MKGRNNIPISPNFNLREFENRDGYVMLHSSILEGLEAVREIINEELGTPIGIFITNAVRTQGDNNRLASKLGWTDQGGTVSRTSKHLWKYGGIAVDIIGVFLDNGEIMDQKMLVPICQEHFDWVRDYKDGHIHCDNRERAK